MITFTNPTQVKTERQMILALLRHYDHRVNRCFWNSHLLHWESDFLVVSKSRYMTEVEIKTDWQDWRNDHKKEKWNQFGGTRYWRYVKKFLYAVPHDLYEKHGHPPSIPDTAGILTVRAKSNGGFPVVKEVRPAAILPGHKPLEAKHLVRLYTSTYYRQVEQFIRSAK